MSRAADPLARHRLCVKWVTDYKVGTHELNQWCTPGRRSDFWRGYAGLPLHPYEGGPCGAYLMGAECRDLIDAWVAALQKWHDQH